MTREDVSALAPDALICDGFDEAIIGVADRIGQQPIIAYNTSKIIEILMKRDDMSYQDAVEYFEFNIFGAWVGELTPIFIQIEI